MRRSTYRSAQQFAVVVFALSSIVAQTTIGLLKLPLVAGEGSTAGSPWALTYYASNCLKLAEWSEKFSGIRLQFEGNTISGTSSPGRMASVTGRPPSPPSQLLLSGNARFSLSPTHQGVKAGSGNTPAASDRTTPLVSAVWAKSRDCQTRAVLTFDDGPSTYYTPAVLDILKDEGVCAVFFVVGAQAEARPELLVRMAAEGHEIGNHTYTHLNPASATCEEIVAEIERTSRVVEQATGYPTVWFRPPGGTITPDVIEAAESTQHSIVLWNVDTEDWRVAKESNADQLVIEAISNTSIPETSIVLMHDGGGPRNATVSALRPIIKHLKDTGYEICSLMELTQEIENNAATAPQV